MDLLGVLPGLGVPFLLWGGILALWAREVRKARRVAAALGLQEHPESTRWRPRAEGVVEGRRMELWVSWHLRERFLVLATPCAVPAGFALVLGDAGPARRAGVRTRGLRAVKTGWRGFDGWAWPRSSDPELAVAMLRRCRASLNAAPRSLFVHDGRIAVVQDLMHVRPGEAAQLAGALRRGAEDLEAVARDPAARAAAHEPERAPEVWGAEDEAPGQIA